MKTFEEMTETVRQAKAPDAVAKTVDAALRNLPARETQAGIPSPASPALKVVPGKRTWTLRPWQAVAGVAACAAVVGCLVASPLLQDGLPGSADTDLQSPTSQLSTTSDSDILGGMFRVTPAYGDELALADSADPTRLVLADQGTGQMGETGCFTGLTFKVEGDSIAQVSANVSQGQLYRMTRTVITDDDVDAMANAGQFEDTDGAVHMIHGDFDGKETEGKVGIDDYCVALGSSFVEDYDPNVAYGFYQPGSFDAQLAEDDPKASFWSLFDSFNGAVLEITVTFTDGSTETKTYDLASGMLKVEWGAEGESCRLLQEFATSENEPFVYGLLATQR